MKPGVLGRVASRHGSWDSSGSVVLFALFVCLAIAASVQSLAVVALCCERARSDEAAGRRRLADIDVSLAELTGLAGGHWMPASMDFDGYSLGPLKGRLVESGDSPEWVLQAEVADDTTERQAVTSALVERGRDGLDLPRAAVVAGSLRAASGRAKPWMVAGAEGPGGEEMAVAYAKSVVEPQAIGPNCLVKYTTREWGLGDGWVEALKTDRLFGPRVFVVTGQKGEVVSPPSQIEESSRESPVLVVGIGGVSIDLREVGEFWGVVVAEGGSVQLDGTVVYGAVLAGDCVEFGEIGQLVYCSDVLLWATDRSLERVRLVPGTRLENTE
jgi:hypothetical protein